MGLNEETNHLNSQDAAAAAAAAAAVAAAAAATTAAAVAAAAAAADEKHPCWTVLTVEISRECPVRDGRELA